MVEVIKKDLSNEMRRDVMKNRERKTEKNLLTKKGMKRIKRKHEKIGSI